MKYTYKILLSFIVLLSFIGLSGYKILKNKTFDSLDHRSLLTAVFHSNMDAFENDIAELHQVSEQFFASKASVEELRLAHTKARNAYKRIELFADYYDHEAVSQFINGVPLPSLETGVAQVVVLEASGLQVLDELVFEDVLQKEDILAQSLDLKKNFKNLSQYLKNIQIHDRHAFEASRFQVIRLYTLGLTGFDTPGSKNGIEESKIALQSIQEVMGIYSKSLKDYDKDCQLKLEKLLSQSVNYLEDNNDFDTFDRLFFLKEYVNPLYSLILTAQKILNIETINETAKVVQPINYEARNMFDEDFLNVHYYTGYKIEEDLFRKRADLGKILFFDPVLSGNNERACASCHKPELAFTDGYDKSIAFNKEDKIARNSPTVLNCVYSESFFHDMREPDLERQIKHVVLSDVEFHTDFLEIEEKLSKSEAYKKLFLEAYADYPEYALSKWSVSNALTCYMSELTTLNSPFDQYVRGEIAEIGQDVKQGYNLFMGKAACGTCHFAPVFNGTVPPWFEKTDAEVLGVPANKDTLNPILDGDLGQYRSERPKDVVYYKRHAFKTATVRNIALTSPYMHNGVYGSLEEVMDFYNKGGGAGMGIDIPNQTLPDKPLNLTKKEQEDIIKFLEALTDTIGTTSVPKELPSFPQELGLNVRKIGGAY